VLAEGCGPSGLSVISASAGSAGNHWQASSRDIGMASIGMGRAEFAAGGLPVVCGPFTVVRSSLMIDY
jgi:hypothetical protein